MTLAAIPLDEYQAKAGQELGLSAWFTLDQPRIDTFAEVTEDRQFIHVDPARAAATPFGGTIAHGFLTLSMLSVMLEQAVPPIAGAQMAVNYGFNAVRFLSPIRSGKRVRGRFTLKEMKPRGGGQWQSAFDVSIEIEGEKRPALAAEWLVVTVVGEAG